MSGDVRVNDGVAVMSPSDQTTVELSVHDKIVAEDVVAPRGMFHFTVRPGTYRLDVIGIRNCSGRAIVRSHKHSWASVTCTPCPACGVASASDIASGPVRAALLGLHRATVEGVFLGVGGTGVAAPMNLSGTVRFVTDHGRRTYRAKAEHGHWMVKLPPGTYVVQGRSKQVNDGGSWSTARVITVHTGRETDVRVIYGTIR